MVIRGGSRGNGRQLAYYLLQQKDNEHIRILDIDGERDPADRELHDALFDMSVTAELTKSNKGLYHAQINPDTEASQSMNDKDWLEASDILAKQLGMEQQRRAIVLHTKKGRTHAHVVWERYDHEAGKMVSDSFSRLAQDRARKEMEQVFEHAPTPHRNQHRPELKASLLQLWNQTATGAQFITACKKNRYLIAEGSGRSPYVVVDENGRSYDLARQLKGVKLKEVRARLRHETLLGEKDAIIIQRNAKSDSDTDTGKSKEKQKKSPKIKPTTMSKEETQPHKDDGSAAKLQQQYQYNTTTTYTHGGKPPQKQEPSPEKEQDKKQQYAENKEQVTGQKQQQQDNPTARKGFAANKQDVTGDTEEKLPPLTSQEKTDALFGRPISPDPDEKKKQPASGKEQFADNKEQITEPKQQQPEPKPDQKQQFNQNQQEMTGQQPETEAPQPSQKQAFRDSKHEATGQDDVKEQFAENKDATEPQQNEQEESEKRREAFRQRSEERKQRRTRGRGPSR